MAGSLAKLDASLIAGLSPRVYGLPGEAELQKLFSLRFILPPSGNIPGGTGTGFIIIFS